MSLAAMKTVTDICVFVENIEDTVRFYTEKLGLKLRRRAEGFADFEMDGITLAAWELDHIHHHAGVSNQRGPRMSHKACIAIELPAPAEVDRLHGELSARGVEFTAPPQDYVWNARCVYFSDPDGMLWELYAWKEGGPDDYHDPSKYKAKA